MAWSEKSYFKKQLAKSALMVSAWECETDFAGRLSHAAIERQSFRKGETMLRLPKAAFALFYLASTLMLQAQEPATVANSPTASAAKVSHASLEDVPLEMKGDLLMARGEYEAALDAYQHALPRTAVTWNKVGVAFHHLFALDEAMKNYKLAISLDPHYAGAYNNLGAVYHGKHEFSLAERAYKRAIKYEPHMAVTYWNLGTTYFAESKYKKGIKAYQEALAIDPEVFSPQRRDQIEEGSSREQRMAISFFLAEAYASTGRTEEALAALRKALAEGFSDRKRLMEDKALGSIRATPEFHELLAGAQLE